MAAKKSRRGDDDTLSDDSSLPTMGDDLGSPSFQQEDDQIGHETGVDEESGFYTMGDIKVDEAEDTSEEEFKKASKTLKPDEEDEDEEWVDDADVNLDDRDDFLDDEFIDPENYEYEKEDY